MTVITKLAEMYPDYDVTKVTLEDAGIDSFGMVQIILEMEETFQVVFEDEIDPTAFKTLGEFAYYLEEKMSYGSC